MAAYSAETAALRAIRLPKKALRAFASTGKNSVLN
jgi:hypothetical protein